jgi:hypothetical protein
MFRARWRERCPLNWDGVVPVVALAERAGLPELLAERVRPGGGCGVNAPLKVGCLVADMAAGAGLMCPTVVPS